MGRVIVQASMSLDGFIADTKDQVGPLFDWHGNGDVEFTGSDPNLVFHVSAPSADYLRRAWSNVATDVIGRRLFDLTNGWNGRPAVGDSVFVVTHEPPTNWPFPDAPFTFVTNGVESALAQAQAFAGERDVSLAAGNLAGQALRAGLIDECGSISFPLSSARASDTSGQRRVPVAVRGPGDRQRRPGNSPVLSSAKVMIIPTMTLLPVVA